MTILKTSTIWVLSSTHRLLRQINYSRREVGNEIKPLIQIQGYDARGQLSRLVDARFSEGYLQKPKTTNPNYKQLSTLSGVVLRSESVDAGMRFGLSDVRGNALYGIDSRETEQTYEYDGIGRLIACFEAEKGQERVCKERFVYGGKETKGMNGIHRLVQHYDTAGMEGIVNYTIQGKVTTQKRQFLQASAKVDWTQGFKGLEDAVYETGWNYNGLGEVLAQTDAKGNVQHSRYAVSGQLETSTMQLKGKEEQVVVRGIGYAANGQVLQKEYSNGIRVHYHYESRTQRLRQLESIRLKDNKQLQDLRYVYDPVGNILEVRDKSKGTGFYANGKTESVSHYRYDSLYQLIEASGIESQLAGRETSQLPQEIAFGNKDASRCVNYKRVYQYDAGGNLVEMQHQGASQYTQRIEIDATSNRGLEAGSKRTFKQSFDGNGNVLYLVTEPLKWDGKNQLSEVTQIVRKTLSDKESYRYDGSGQRIEKLTQRIAESQLHYERVRYLPGLELRERWQTDLAEENKKLTEELHVIQMQDSRVLHWENEKPEEISNDDLRYSLTDQLGSIQLELNSAGKLISYESYYPYGGTAIWSTRNRSEVNYKFVRYSGKERDSTGLYYYGYRYYAPWLCRWLNPDPSGIEQGLNFYQMVNNNPIMFIDTDGKSPSKLEKHFPMDTARTPHRRIIATQTTSVSAIAGQMTSSTQGSLVPFYLIRDETLPKERLMVFTHGMYSEQYDSDLELKDNMPTITVLGPHGKILGSNPELSEELPYAKITSKGIWLMSEAAKKDYEDFGYRVITGSVKEKTIKNYTLNKVSTEYLGKNSKPISTMFEWYHNAIANANSPLEILALRGKAHPQRKTPYFFYGSGDIVASAIGYYKEVIFSFCRIEYEWSNVPAEQRPKHTITNNIQLTSPEFIPWSDATTTFSDPPSYPPPQLVKPPIPLRKKQSNANFIDL